MEIISKEKYLKIHYGDRKNYFRLDKLSLKPIKFSTGDVIHTIDCHYLEDDEGNDINQEIIFVNPNVVTGEYRVVGEAFDGGWSCIKIMDIFGGTGTTAYVGKNVIFENYKNSNMI